MEIISMPSLLFKSLPDYWMLIWEIKTPISKWQEKYLQSIDLKTNILIALEENFWLS